MMVGLALKGTFLLSNRKQDAQASCFGYTQAFEISDGVINAFSQDATGNNKTFTVIDLLPPLPQTAVLFFPPSKRQHVLCQESISK